MISLLRSAYIDATGVSCSAMETESSEFTCNDAMGAISFTVSEVVLTLVPKVMLNDDKTPPRSKYIRRMSFHRCVMHSVRLLAPDHPCTVLGAFKKKLDAQECVNINLRHPR